MTQLSLAEPSTAPPSELTVLKLVVAYDGTGFHGFAPQPGVRTVGGVLHDALEGPLGGDPVLACAGRTDVGVHAYGQVVSLPVDRELDPVRVVRAVNGALAPEVVVRSAELVAAPFDARHDACWRTYRYTIVNRPVPDPFRARYAWWVPQPLDLRVLRLAADPFVGEHDYAAFCRKGPEGSTTRRRVLRSIWHDEGDGILVYEIAASAFCWQMVRAIVGTLVEGGTGRRTPGEMLSVLRSGDRARAGRVAPPQGLCLCEVGYSMNRFLP